jgi:DNA-binding transcriptional LysR family regulator
MTMDLKKLRGFVTVAEKGTVSLAAETLRITQPALSRQLQDLQAEFGVALFNQVGRRLRLTAEGAALLPECRSLLGHAETLAERGRALTQGDRGVLRVGATAHFIANFFPGLLHKFAAAFPYVRLQTVEGGGLDHLDALRNGDLHAAISTLEGHEDEFTTFPLPASKLLVAYRPDASIRIGRQVEVHDLAGLPLLVLTPSFAIRKTFDAACRLARMTPKLACESTAPETLLALAREGHGLAVVPTTASIDSRKLRLAPLMFRGSPLSMPIGVLWNSQQQQPRYAGAFNTTLASHMQSVLAKLDDRSGRKRRQTARGSG